MKISFSLIMTQLQGEKKNTFIWCLLDTKFCSRASSQSRRLGHAVISARHFPLLSESADTAVGGTTQVCRPDVTSERALPELTLLSGTTLP